MDANIGSSTTKAGENIKWLVPPESLSIVIIPIVGLSFVVPVGTKVTTARTPLTNQFLDHFGSIGHNLTFIKFGHMSSR